MPNDYELLSLQEVRDITGLNREAVYTLIRQKQFPPPAFFKRRNMWKRQDIDKWMDCQLNW